MNVEEVHFYDESVKILECFVNSKFTKMISECRHPFFPMVCASYPRYGGPFQVNIHSLDHGQMAYVLDTLKFCLETETYPSFDVAMAIIVHPFRKNQDRIKAYMEYKEYKNPRIFIEHFKLVKSIVDFILSLLKIIKICYEKVEKLY